MARPVAHWYTGDRLADAEPGEVVLIDTGGKHRPRIVGRVLRQHPERPGVIILRTRDATIAEVDGAIVSRFRILDHVFPIGKGAYHLPTKCNVVVIGIRDGDQYLVEPLHAERFWSYEGDLIPKAPRLPKGKRGRLAKDARTEAVNAAVRAERQWAE